MNPVPVSQFEGATAFLDFIRERIGHAPDAINQTGKIQRFSTNGKRGDLAGWCVWYGMAGACGNWRTGESHTWRSDRYQRLTKTERQRIDRQIRQAEARRKRELEAGESTTLKVTAYRDGLKEERTRPRILMITNDPERAKVVVRIKTK